MKINLNSKILSLLKEDDENLFKPRRLEDRATKEAERERQKKERIKSIVSSNPVLKKIYEFMITTDRQMGNKPYIDKKIQILLKYDLVATFEFGNRTYGNNMPMNHLYAILK
jgi:hypothetical protein